MGLCPQSVSAGTGSAVLAVGFFFRVSESLLSGCRNVSFPGVGMYPFRVPECILSGCRNLSEGALSAVVFILIAAGLGIWAAALIVYWFFTTPSDAFGYGLFFLYLLLPATIFAFSFIAGKNDFWGRFKWRRYVYCPNFIQTNISR